MKGFTEGGFLLLDPNNIKAQDYVKAYNNFIWGKPYQIEHIDDFYGGVGLIRDEEGRRIQWPLKWAIPIAPAAPTQEEIDQLIG